MKDTRNIIISSLSLAMSLSVAVPAVHGAEFLLGPEEIVEANGSPISVQGYSVPSFAYWNGDDLKDLIIGQGGGGYPEGKVRVYLNVGTDSMPQFDDDFYAESVMGDIVCVASG